MRLCESSSMDPASVQIQRDPKRPIQPAHRRRCQFPAASQQPSLVRKRQSNPSVHAVKLLVKLGR